MRRGPVLQALPQRIKAGRALRAMALAAAVLSMAACTTTGRTFDTSELNRIVPGQTTLEQTVAILKAEPENVYRQLDGSATARWASKASVLTDAVYFRRELTLRFDSAGRFQRVVDQVNVSGDVGQAPQPAVARQQPDHIDQAMPRSVQQGFPYGPAQFGEGPVHVYPVR